MFKTSMKALLGASAVALMGAVTMAPGAQAACTWTNSAWDCSAQPQQPGPNGQAAMTQPVNPPPAEQNAYVPPPATGAPGNFPPGNFPQGNPRYPGPKLN